MSTAELPFYDRFAAIARLGGDESLFAEMARMFIAECDGYCQALENALKAGDVSMVRREAHTLKSLMATFSCDAGQVPAQQLEHLAACGQLDGSGLLAAQIVAAVRQLAAALAAE